MADSYTETVLRLWINEHEHYMVEDTSTTPERNGVRLSWRHDRTGDSDDFDIVGDPDLLREIAAALLVKADEQEARDVATRNPGGVPKQEET